MRGGRLGRGRGVLPVPPPCPLSPCPSVPVTSRCPSPPSPPQLWALGAEERAPGSLPFPPPPALLRGPRVLRRPRDAPASLAAPRASRCPLGLLVFSGLLWAQREAGGLFTCARRPFVSEKLEGGSGEVFALWQAGRRSGCCLLVPASLSPPLPFLLMRLLQGSQRKTHALKEYVIQNPQTRGSAFVCRTVFQSCFLHRTFQGTVTQEVFVLCLLCSCSVPVLPSWQVRNPSYLKHYLSDPIR